MMDKVSNFLLKVNQRFQQERIESREASDRMLLIQAKMLYSR